MFLFQDQGATLDTGGILGIVFGFISSCLTIWLTFKQAKLKEKVAETETKAQVAEVSVSETKVLLEAWKELSAINSQRITSLENRIDAKDAATVSKDAHILDCEKRTSHLEGQMEILKRIKVPVIDDKKNDC